MIGEPLLVMLIEDNNVDHAELVIRTLQEHKIANNVRHFLDGQAALDYLLQRGEYSDQDASPRPHLILLTCACRAWMVLTFSKRSRRTGLEDYSRRRPDHIRS